jgi:hypothetical protein
MIPAGWWPAAPALAMHCSIRSRSLHQSRRRACSSPLVCSILTKEPRQTNCRVLSAATSSTPSPLSNPHSARGTASALPPAAISCLGAFRTPAAAARGKRRHAGVRKPAQFPTSTVRHNFQTRLPALFSCNRPDLTGPRWGEVAHPRQPPGADAISAARTPANTICICHSPHPMRPEADIRRIVPKRRGERRLASLYGR